MSKKRYVALGLGTLMLVNSTCIFGNTPIVLEVNEKQIQMDVAPIKENGTTFVPISFIAKELGASVNWMSPEVLITEGTNEVRCTVQSKEASLNGEKIELTSEPRLEEGRVLVPLRFVSEALGAKVDYESGTNTIRITKEVENIEVEQPMLEQETQYHVFFDETSDYYIYELKYLSEENIWAFKYFLYDTVNQSWSALSQTGWAISDGDDGQYPRVNGKGYLNLKDKKFIEGVSYKQTPDGKRRYIEKREWSSFGGREDVGFIQDVATGVVKEAFRSMSSPVVHSLPDNTFFIEISVPRVEEADTTYPEDLFIYNPSTDELTLVAAGQRSYYIPSKGVVIYKKNSKSYAYNISTKEIQVITEADYEHYFEVGYAEGQKVNDENAPILPSKEEREKFPQMKIETVPNNIGVLTINEKTECLPFMFQKNNEVYIPAKNIINLTGMQVMKKDEVTREAVLGNQKVTLDKNNSATFDERLYISEIVLQQLGVNFKASFNF